MIEKFLPAVLLRPLTQSLPTSKNAETQIARHSKLLIRYQNGRKLSDSAKRLVGVRRSKTTTGIRESRFLSAPKPLKTAPFHSLRCYDASQLRTYSTSSESPYCVKPGDRVSVHMKVEDPETDTVIVETLSSNETVSFLVGQGQVIPGMEKICVGMKVGETWSGVIGPNDGFGIRDPSKTFDASFCSFEPDVLSSIQLGSVVVVNGRNSPGRVVSIDKENRCLTIDENHEYAGKDLRFWLELVHIDSSSSAWSGVTVEPVKPGDGRTYAAVGDLVRIHYVAQLASNGKILDSTLGKEALRFKVGSRQVIRGLDDAISNLSVGERAKLYIPSEFGYGQNPLNSMIPPDSNLIFEVELLEVLKE